MKEMETVSIQVKPTKTIMEWGLDLLKKLH